MYLQAENDLFIHSVKDYMVDSMPVEEGGSGWFVWL